MIRRLLPHIPAAALVLALLAPAPGAAVERIEVMALFKDRAVMRLDGRQRMLVAGERSPEGVLLVEADANGAVVEVDGERRSLSLGNRISGRYAPPEGTEDIVHVAPDGRGMYVINGSINGFQVRFLVDTGASHIAINSHLARRVGIRYMEEGQQGITSTASGVTTSYQVTLDRVRVGDIELRDVAATVLDGDFPSEALLGMSFLGKVDMNRNGGILQLKRRR
ncbi:MAG: TIGR02281 family clan AA aspartic protease [Gammaproteobacteria bacterium]|nr:TIGR02281 family clan AA aspartic protease [Gammaproteobacteria bacterium]